MSGVKVGGVWRTPATVSVKVAGAWRTAATVSVKVGGAWHVSTMGGAPAPVMTYVSAGVFEVSNTEAGVYTATLVSGSGTATQTTVGGKIRFTLSEKTARFSVTFAYAVGAPQSQPDYMERKEYAHSCRTVPETCGSPCNCSLVGSNCYCVAPGPSGCPAGTTPNNECGCAGTSTPCMGGSIGHIECQICYSDCSYEVCDVLINEPDYTNSGSEWYKVA